LAWEGRKPPPVTANLPQGAVRGVLLAWARIGRTGRWAAGISYLHRAWHSRSLITVWVPAALVQPSDPDRRADPYRRVPRVTVAGPPRSWPPLPPYTPPRHKSGSTATVTNPTTAPRQQADRADAERRRCRSALATCAGSVGLLLITGRRDIGAMRICHPPGVPSPSAEIPACARS
jgi:hypothetical protein